MWEPVYKVETRVTVMGREPWELGVLVAVLFFTNYSSRAWAGALGSVAVTAIVTTLASLALKRFKQALPPQAMTHFWSWLLSKDLYLVGREELCKPLVLKRQAHPSRTRLEPSVQGR